MASEIVQVTADIQDSAVKISNFGIPLILAYHTNGGGMATYSTTDLPAVVTAGFSITHDVYRKMVAAASQSPGVPNVKVYPRAAENSQLIVLTPTELTEGFVYGPFNVEATAAADVTVTVPAAADEEAVVDLLVTEIDAIGGVSAVKVGVGAAAVVNVTATATEERVYIDNCPRELTLKDTSVDAGVGTDFNNALTADPDFYGVVLDAESEAEALVLAPLCEAANKIFLAQSADSDIAESGSTDLASDLQTAGYHYTATLATRYMSTQGAMGLLATMFARTPGTATWALKDIAGAGADDWNGTEIVNLDNKSVIRFENVDGVRRTMHGWAASGRFLDLTRGTDYLVAQIKANVLTNLVNLDKVPQTNVGIGLVESWVRTPMQAAESIGLLAAGWDVTVPKISEVSDVDKINRLLDNVKFTGTFGGAWHKIIISGSLKAA